MNALTAYRRDHLFEMKYFISFTVPASIALAGLCILCLFPGPVQAQAVPTDTVPQLREEIKPTDIKSRSTDEGEPDKAEEEPVDIKALGRKKEKSDVPLPLRMVSFTTGFVVGTPIAITRCAIKQTRAGTRDLVGDSKNPLLVVPATIISMPFGAMGGPFEGLGYAAVNSWRGSGDEPFGQEAFSLGDSID